MTAPRLLIVTTVASTIRHFLFPYIDHFRGLGWTVEAACGVDVCTEKVRPRVDTLHDLPFSRSGWPISPRAVLATRGLIGRGDFDIIHVHTPIAAFVVRSAVGTLSRSTRPPVVYTAHGFHFVPGRKRWTDLPYRAAEKLAGLWTDRLIVINETDAKTARELGLVTEGAVVLMPGIGIDLDHYLRSPEIIRRGCELRHRLGIGNADPVISVLAEFAPGKNHAVLIEALGRVDRTDIHLICAGGGDGDLMETIRRRCASLGFDDRVHFLGEVDDVRPLIATSTLTALPSRREGLSRAVLESLAMGVPVLGGDTRGITDSVVPDGGIVVDPDDVDGFAQGVRELIDRPTEHFDRAAVAERMKRYTTDELITLHEDLYRELGATPRRPIDRS